MAVDVNSEEGQLIRKFVPLAKMPGPVFNELCAEIAVEEIRNGFLFKKGDRDGCLVYLLSGEVILQAEGLVIETISAGSDAARFALAHQIPRKIDAVANGAVRILRLDADRVNNLPPLVYKEEVEYMVVDESEDNTDDWMTALLKSPVFQRLPPANLQKILISLEQVSIDKGEIIIEQGAAGDYYYLLKSGQCLITRKPAPAAKEIKLGLLEKGDTFGEDSLITDAPRNVTISALTNVTLLRLGKKQFVSLIKEPSLKFIDYGDLANAVEQGAVLLDIRTPDEYEKRHLDGSINVPFFSLRMQIKTLSRDKTAIVICADGKASEGGAFLLLKNRFKAFILKGGMDAVPLPQETAQFTIDDGIETLVNLSVHADHRSLDDSLEDQIRLLKAENDALRKTHHDLAGRCAELEAEKEQIEKRYRLLSEQMENLNKQLEDLHGK